MGPGNIYVATAKKLVFGQVGIDMVAGPSEILVISDGGTDPTDRDGPLRRPSTTRTRRRYSISLDRAHLDAVEASIRRLLPTMERADVIRTSLSRRGALIEVRDLDEAADVANRIAPEHLELSVEDPESLVVAIRNAGAIFMGRYTAEVLGDYCAGPNHVLPTSGTARFSSPLGVRFPKAIEPDFLFAQGADHWRGPRRCWRGRRVDRPRPFRRVPHPTIAMTDLQGMIRSLLRPEVLALSAYHVPDSSGYVKLDAMENPYSWPDDMVDEWLARLREARPNRYPDPSCGRLKARLREAYGVPEAAGLLMGNGSDEIIQIILMALKGRDATVLAPEPTFVMYRQIASSLGLEFVGVPLREADFALDMPAMRAMIETHRPAVVFLAYPNNPTGNLFDADDIAEILRIAPGLVVLDEAYTAYAGRSFMPRLAEFDNLLSCVRCPSWGWRD